MTESAVKHDAGKRKLSLVHHRMANLILNAPTLSKTTSPKSYEEGIKGPCIRAYLYLNEMAHRGGEDFESILFELIEFVGVEKSFALTATAMEYGLEKYGRNIWKNGIEWSRLIDAGLRHLLAIITGEEIDKESGNPHLSHFFGCMNMLVANVSGDCGPMSINDLM